MAWVLTHRCMRCLREEKNALHYWSGEILCRRCWKLVPQHYARLHNDLRRIARRLEKEENQGYRVDEDRYGYVARRWALCWARIRRDLSIESEYPAGLLLFLFHMRML